jgi:hypothetical protein
MGAFRAMRGWRPSDPIKRPDRHHESGSGGASSICLARAVRLSSASADFPLNKRVLDGLAGCLDMAHFTGCMARISCIAMGGEVWFERHESIVMGRYFRSMAAGWIE